MISPEEDAAKLDDRKNTVLEKDDGVFDRCHGERVKKFETVENFEPVKQRRFAQDLKMPSEAVM